MWALRAVLSSAECAAAVDAAEAYAAANGGWLAEGHHEHYRTIDLVAAEIPALFPLLAGTPVRSAAGTQRGNGGSGAGSSSSPPEVDPRGAESLVAELLAEVAAAFPRACPDGTTVWLKDLFIVKYEAEVR